MRWWLWWWWWWKWERKNRFCWLWWWWMKDVENDMNLIADELWWNKKNIWWLPKRSLFNSLPNSLWLGCFWMVVCVVAVHVYYSGDRDDDDGQRTCAGDKLMMIDRWSCVLVWRKKKLKDVDICLFFTLKWIYLRPKIQRAAGCESG